MIVMKQLVSSSSSTDADVLPVPEATRIARFFQVLADPTRVRIVKALADQSWCVSDLADALEMDQPAISHQLKYLRTIGVVHWRKQGRRVHYELDDGLLRSLLSQVMTQDDLRDEGT